MSFNKEVINATDSKESVSVVQDKTISFSIDGENFELESVNGEKIYALNYEDTVYVPIRSVSEALDVSVSWDSDTNNIDISTVKPITIEEYGTLELETNSLEDILLLDNNSITVVGDVSSIHFDGYTEGNVSLNIMSNKGSLLKTFYLTPFEVNTFELEVVDGIDTLYFVAVSQDIDETDGASLVTLSNIVSVQE